MTLPTLPPEPSPEAPWPDQAAYASLLMRVAEYEQRERNIVASGRLAEATERNADQAKRNADNLRALLDGGLPSDVALTTALDKLTRAIGAAQPAPGPAPIPPAPISSERRLQALVDLVATMPSTRRDNPAAAAEAAAAQLAAIVRVV